MVALGSLLLVALVGSWQQIRVNSLQGDLTAERDARIEDASKLATCRATRTSLLGLGSEQSSALADLRASAEERATRARDVQQQAEDWAQQADQQALQVLQERTPSGADICAAARQAFDDELRRELCYEP